MACSTPQVSFPIGRSPITTVLVRARAFPCRVGVKDTGDEPAVEAPGGALGPQTQQAGAPAELPPVRRRSFSFLSTFTEYILPYCLSFENSNSRVHSFTSVLLFAHSHSFTHQPHTSSPLNDVTISRTNTSSKPLQNALLFRPGAEHPRHRPGRRCQPPQPPCQLPRPSSTDVSGSIPTLTLIGTDNF